LNLILIIVLVAISFLHFVHPLVDGRGSHMRQQPRLGPIALKMYVGS